MERIDLSPGKYSVHRDVLDELGLEEVAQKRMWSTKPTVGEKVKESLRCSVPTLKHRLLTWIPVLSWLPKYSFRENILGDIVSGCSVGIMHLPQGMAYALLASLRPIYGLYTSLFPVLIYVIFGTSRHISIGTFAVISIMVGSVTERMAPDEAFIFNGTNNSLTVDLDARDAYRVQIACSVTLLSGLFQILLGVVRFGFVATYLSEPLVRAYTTGAACHVCVSQLKYLFGVKPARFTGPLSLIYTVVDICRLLPQTKVPELVVSLVALAVLIVVKEINACYSKKLPMPIPIELIVVIGATTIAHFCGLREDYLLDVVGEIPSGLKAPRTPEITFFSQIIGDAIAMAIVSYAITISLGKTFGLKYGYKVDSNQELVALGLSNSVGSFFQCYAVTASLSRSLVQESTGGKTQVAGVISSLLVLVMVIKMGSLFEDLPKAVLSTIVFVNLKGMFRQFKDVPLLWKTDKVDLLVWLVTFISTVLLNLDLGLAVSVGFSMLTFIFKTQLPHYSILGNVPGTDLYLDTEAYKQAKEIPGIKIFRSAATICFTNAELFLEAFQEKSGVDVRKLQMEKKKRAKQEKMAKKEKDALDYFSNSTNSFKVPKPNKEKNLSKDVAIFLTNASSNGHVNSAYQYDTTISETDSGCHGEDSLTHDSHKDEKVGGTCKAVTHSIILDISTTGFVDTVTVKMLKNIFGDFADVDLDIYLAGCQACVVEQLEKAAFFESIPKSRLFVSVHDAVLHILGKLGQTKIVLDDCDTQM
ncbi:solute carrier family 26 member 6 [Oryzias melastigma]|uniref:Solute carrier family 26 member 6, like 2 n=1 Tax=Oryzias melastigma TaxID=30732 RepID=A0A3B3C3P9_ORYME|nr:solute carrier family 26 member 6 [Oryzias melastigma]